MVRALVLAFAVVVTVAGCGPTRQPVPPRIATIVDRVAQYGTSARGRLVPFFAAAGMPYPPSRFLLLGLKKERELQLDAAGPAQQLGFIRSFAILGASGGLGPKLLEGDRQVPEGVYATVYLNPNSVAHLSLALGYPNEFDRAHAAEDGRENAVLGGDIMIHGGSDSVGCLAIGDRAAEDGSRQRAPLGAPARSSPSRDVSARSTRRRCRNWVAHPFSALFTAVRISSMVT